MSQSRIGEVGLVHFLFRNPLGGGFGGGSPPHFFFFSFSSENNFVPFQFLSLQLPRKMGPPPTFPFFPFVIPCLSALPKKKRQGFQYLLTGKRSGFAQPFLPAKPPCPPPWTPKKPFFAGAKLRCCWVCSPWFFPP